MTSARLLNEAATLIEFMLGELPERRGYLPWRERAKAVIYDLHQEVAEHTPVENGGAL